MTAEERKFERARLQTIRKWHNCLDNYLGCGPVEHIGCGFCEECPSSQYDCAGCSLVDDFGNDCVDLTILYYECFDEEHDELYDLADALTSITVLITLHHMAADFVTVDGEPLDEPLIEWVEV